MSPSLPLWIDFFRFRRDLAGGVRAVIFYALGGGDREGAVVLVQVFGLHCMIDLCDQGGVDQSPIVKRLKQAHIIGGLY